MPVIETDLLAIDYLDAGPAEGPVVLLLHGWPDDVSTWAEVAPQLNAGGLRTIAPALRGFGDTRFLDAATPRTGNSAVLAIDAIGLMDKLGIDRFMVAGHDWGSNIAEALAVGWPDRVERMALLSSTPRLGGMPMPPFEHAQLEWYHWFMATKRGAEAVRADRKGFAHIHWVNWSPPGWFDEKMFARVARSFDNPDWVDVTLHSYRSRWDEAEPDPSSKWLDDKVRATKTLSLPTIYIQGGADGVNPPSVSKDVPAKFEGPFALIRIEGVGHFPQRERPNAVARHLLRLFTDNPSKLADIVDRSLSLARARPYAVALGLVGAVAAVAVAGGAKLGNPNTGPKTGKKRHKRKKP